MNPLEAARTDPLTGLGNRRALEEAFPLVLREARSLGKPLPLIHLKEAYGRMYGAKRAKKGL